MPAPENEVARLTAQLAALRASIAQGRSDKRALERRLAELGVERDDTTIAIDPTSPNALCRALEPTVVRARRGPSRVVSAGFALASALVTGGILVVTGPLEVGASASFRMPREPAHTPVRASTSVRPRSPAAPAPEPVRAAPIREPAPSASRDLDVPSVRDGSDLTPVRVVRNDDIPESRD